MAEKEVIVCFCLKLHRFSCRHAAATNCSPEKALIKFVKVEQELSWVVLGYCFPQKNICNLFIYAHRVPTCIQKQYVCKGYLLFTGMHTRCYHAMTLSTVYPPASVLKQQRTARKTQAVWRELGANPTIRGDFQSRQVGRKVLGLLSLEKGNSEREGFEYATGRCSGEGLLLCASKWVGRWGAGAGARRGARRRAAPRGKLLFS